MKTAAATIGMTAAAVLCGCAPTFEVTRYPPFHHTRIQTVAVAPFANLTPRENAGEAIAANLAEELGRTGAYRVVGPDEVRNLLDPDTLAELPDLPYPQQAQILRRAGLDTGAFVTGRLLAAGVITRRVPAGPTFGFGVAAGRNVGYRRAIRPYPHYYNWPEFLVAATAAMVRTADGSPLHTAAELSKHDPAGRTLHDAMTAEARRLAAEFAPPYQWKSHSNAICSEQPPIV